MKSKSVQLVLCAACICIGGAFAQDSHDSHDSHEDHDDHEDHAEGLFEQAAVYDVEAGTNTLIATANSEEDSLDVETLAFMVVPAATADAEGLEEAEEDAEEAWESFVSGAEEPVVLASGEAAVPSNSVVYQIFLEDPLVTVPVELAEDGVLALFLEHGTDEVPVVLVSPSGIVLEAGAEEGGDEEEEEEEDDSPAATGEQWANSLIASLVTSFVSFAGIVLVVNKRVASNIDLSHACMFASGALLVASLLHIVPEALEGLESQYPDDLHSMGLYACLAILIGLSFGVAVHTLLESVHSHSHAGGPPVNVGNKNVGSAPLASGKEEGMVGGTAPAHAIAMAGTAAVGDTGPAPSLQQLMIARKGKSLLDLKDLQPVCWTVILGDLVHNFADGVTVGAAFLGCSSTIGWTVTASIVVHEVPHELADFMALVQGGMSAAQALVYNFLSALSALLGAVTILAMRDSLSSADISFILLVGAGSFIFIGLSELLPGAMACSPAGSGKRSARCNQLLKLVSFVVGALIIGIPLLFDQHCDDGSHAHDH